MNHLLHSRQLDGTRLVCLAGRKELGKLAAVTKVGEFAGMRKGAIAVCFRFQSAVKIVMPDRQGRKVEDSFVTFRPRNQIALRGSENDDSVGEVLAGHIGATTKMRFHPEFTGTQRVEFDARESVPKPTRDAVELDCANL